MKIVEIIHDNGARFGNQLLILCNALKFAEENKYNKIVFNPEIYFLTPWTFGIITDPTHQLFRQITMT